MEKFQVKILRLKTGEDIICFCYENFSNNCYIVKHAKTIYVHYDEDTLDEEYFLLDWMNENIFAYPDVKISSNEVLFSNYATTYFGSLYLENLLETSDIDDDLVENIKKTLDKISDSIEEESIPKNRILH